MNNELKAQLTQVHTMLVDAQGLSASGNHGAAMKLAYEASEHIASGYMAGTTGQQLPPNDATYDLFAKTIQGSDHHRTISDKIGGVVSSVSVLREAYEPVLLDETTPEDAQQMIDCVQALAELVREIADQHSLKS